jgi:hypothetical protein
MELEIFQDFDPLTVILDGTVTLHKQSYSS